MVFAIWATVVLAASPLPAASFADPPITEVDSIVEDAAEELEKIVAKSFSKTDGKDRSAKAITNLIATAEQDAVKAADGAIADITELMIDDGLSPEIGDAAIAAVAESLTSTLDELDSIRITSTPPGPEDEPRREDEPVPSNAVQPESTAPAQSSDSVPGGAADQEVTGADEPTAVSVLPISVPDRLEMPLPPQVRQREISLFSVALPDTIAAGLTSPFALGSVLSEALASTPALVAAAAMACSVLAAFAMWRRGDPSGARS